jgi:hypothetical protein
MRHINSYEKFLESDGYNYAEEEVEYHNRRELEEWQEEEERKKEEEKGDIEVKTGDRPTSVDRKAVRAAIKKVREEREELKRWKKMLSPEEFRAKFPDYKEDE